MDNPRIILLTTDITNVYHAEVNIFYSSDKPTFFTEMKIALVGMNEGEL